MKMYLSSYRLGDESEQLKSMIPENNKAGFVSNALDSSVVDLERKKRSEETEMVVLRELGMDIELLDLRDYFGKEDSLREKVKEYDVIWVRGGNVFVLRQAMKLSGFDTILKELQERNDFLYGAYSAGVCVLGPTLDGYHLVDDATETPYEEQKEVLWDGLGILDYVFLPHYKSDHPESADIDKELEYCKEKCLPYRTARDGEVIIHK